MEHITTGSASVMHTDSWVEAWKFATDAHQGQLVPGSDRPYLCHIGNVVIELLAAHAASPIEDVNLAVVCAALHDCVEDQGVSIDTLREKFGATVAAGVARLIRSSQRDSSKKSFVTRHALKRFGRTRTRRTQRLRAPPRCLPAR